MRKSRGADRSAAAARGGARRSSTRSSRPAAEGPDAKVLAPTTYAEQRKRAARVTLSDQQIDLVLRQLIAAPGNRMDQSTASRRARRPAGATGGALPMVQRLLNVEQYPVLDRDADGVTIVLDLDLLKEQFGVVWMSARSVSARRRREVLDALRRGTVPHNGLDLLAVGLGSFEAALDAELDSVRGGGAVFKAVRGEYGSGKTFFSRWLGERAKRIGMAVAEVQISETETPLHKLETVYRRVCESLETCGVPALGLPPSPRCLAVRVGV